MKKNNINSTCKRGKYLNALLRDHHLITVSDIEKNTLYHHNGFSTSIIDYVFLSEDLKTDAPGFTLDTSTMNSSSHVPIFGNVKFNINTHGFTKSQDCIKSSKKVLGKKCDHN